MHLLLLVLVFSLLLVTEIAKYIYGFSPDRVGCTLLSRQSPCQGTLQVHPWTLNGFVPEADVPDKGSAGTPGESETEAGLGNTSRVQPFSCMRSPGSTHSVRGVQSR